MKKSTYAILACLLVAVVSLSFVGLRKMLHKKKHPRSHAIVSWLPPILSYDAIHGKNRESMIASLHDFPTSAYQLFSLPNGNRFYLDKINDVIKQHLRKGKSWEKHIQALIRQHARPGSTVLDIGAHIGVHTLLMSQTVGSEGKVLAFEPQPKIFRELFLNMAVNDVYNIDFYWAAVGDHEGTIELSPLRKGNEGGTILAGGSGAFVELIPIDALHLANVSLIKIDAEEMEDQVLDGARETLLANKPVVLIEIMGGYDFGSTTPEIRKKILHTIDKLEGLGYRVTQTWRHDWIAMPPESS